VQVKGHLQGAMISEVEGRHPRNGDSLGKSCACANASGFDPGKGGEAISTAPRWEQRPIFSPWTINWHKPTISRENIHEH
jgi:hypothetical protein